jgi:hypothetical protein
VTVGISAAHANAVLNVFRTTTYTGLTLFVALHTGDPGASGTANASAVTTRRSATFGAPSGGSMALSSMSGTYAMTATETISHLSFWDASSAGTFLGSATLTTSRGVINGDTLSLTTLTLAHTPIAA